MAAYASVVLMATLWPTPLDQGFESSINKLFVVLYRNGVPLWFGYNKLEFTANVLMFIPLGFLVALLLPARIWWLALVICPAMSIAIEMTQALALSARFATVIDVFSNSLGAVIGILIAVMLRAIVYERDQKVIARAVWAQGLR
ncbi:VanZ family protein [Cryobacterium adonitolivorans]|uniref:VanZ family protein n=1 Tax=Cryobacterium adonitolivorans TaxID=1259189 RepID=UPI0030B9AF56